MARPGQIFSENIGGPWTPEVWKVGPDALVAEARQELWDNTNRMGTVLDSAGDAGAISGPHSSMTNERAEKLVDVDKQGGAIHSSNDIPNNGPGPGRKQLWQDTVRQMHDTQSFAVPD